MVKEVTRTFETRIHIDKLIDEPLQAFADLFAHVKHRLFAEIASGKKAHDLKNAYLIRHKITARQFNAARVQVEGKIASITQRRPGLIQEAKERIASLTQKIKRLKDKQTLHQKKRRLASMEHKLARLEEDHKKGTVRCSFGSKKLFRAQFALEAHGYGSHEEWLSDWQKARTGELFFLGSKDEASGNQTCTATLEPDQTLTLRIRLPDALNRYGKYLMIPQVAFTYGKEELLHCLSHPQAISWRLLRDEKGWRLFATFTIKPAPCISNAHTGVIGLDINVNHLALTEVNSQGNPLSTKVIPFNLYGKRQDCAKAIIGDAAAAAVAYAESRCKPLVLEDLNFQKKKSELKEKHCSSHARVLSSFSYRSLITHLKSRAIKKGIEVAQVNPAYTSIMGRVKFAGRYGLSIHQAAALTIGRRHLDGNERVPLTLQDIPDGKGGHVTLSLPVRIRDKHVWSQWSYLSKKLSAALVARFRTAKSRSHNRHELSL